MSSWFFFGTGNLYGAPFHARCLLYQLHDIDRSILVYHKRNVFSVDVGDQMRDQIKRDYASLNKPPFQIANIVGAKSYPVTEVFVHHINSSTASLSKLIESPPIQLNLSDETNLQCSFEETGVMLERAQLPPEEMLSAYPGRGNEFEQQISQTAYWVKGPVGIAYTGREVEKKFGSLRGAKMHCWKVSVGDLSRKQYYDVTESRNWSLTALQVDEGWKVTSAMYLEKRG